MNEYQLPSGELVNERGLQKAFPYTRFHKPPTASSLADNGVIPVLQAPKPTPSTNLKQVIRDGVTIDALGNTVQAYREVDMFSDYTDQDTNTVVTKLEQETDYLAKLEQDTIEAKYKAVDAAVTQVIRTQCQSEGYENEDSIAKYLVPTNPFYTQASGLSLWIGNVWATVVTIQTAVAGGAVEPTIDELIAQLPTRG